MPWCRNGVKAGGYEVGGAQRSVQELQVRGRADGFDGVRQQLEEIKTYRGRLDGVRPHHRALHWAQARVYGHLLCQERGLERIKLALVYFQIGSAEETVLVEECSATELQAFSNRYVPAISTGHAAKPPTVRRVMRPWRS